jgi:WD40 repeat protein
VSAERLAEALWGEHPPASWTKVVQGCVVRLRKAISPEAISPDGTLLATADGSQVVVVDPATLTERTRLLGHTDPVTELGLSHDGTLLASASDDRTVVVWDIASGERREVLRGHAGASGVWGSAPTTARCTRPASTERC